MKRFCRTILKVPQSVGGAHKVGLFYQRIFGAKMIYDADAGIVDFAVGHHENPQFLRFVTKYLIIISFFPSKQNISKLNGLKNVG